MVAAQRRQRSGGSAGSAGSGRGAAVGHINRAPTAATTAAALLLSMPPPLRSAAPLPPLRCATAAALPLPALPLPALSPLRCHHGADTACARRSAATMALTLPALAAPLPPWR
jgi:hypothetical protein